MTQSASLPHTLKDKPGFVLWLTGLSGSGKSTLGHLMEGHFRARGIHPVMLDGDAIRTMLIEPAGHDRISRLRIAKFNARLCRFLSLQGLPVICPTISLFHEVQAWNRTNIPGYIEIFLDVPMAELMHRDSKGIYSRASRGEIREVVGLDIPAEFPTNPDMHLRFDSDCPPDHWLAEVVAFLDRNKTWQN